MSRRPDFATLLLVSIVALLIWLVAVDYTNDDAALQTSLDFTVTNTEHFLIKPNRTEVTLIASGPKRALNKMRNLIQNETLSLSSPSKQGSYTFEDIAKLLENLPEVKETGASIVTSEPTNFTVEITELVSVDAVVQPRMPAGSLVQDPIVSPEVATITLPKDETQQLSENLTLEAIVDASEIEHLEPGVLHTVNGTLRMPENLGELTNVHIEPATARVSFRLVARNRSITLEKVYVQILLNPEVMSSFKVTLPDSLLNSVQVEASTALAEQLEAGSQGDSPGTRVVAVVPLSHLELERGITSKPVAYFMALAPDGTGEAVSASVDGNAHPEIQLEIGKITPTTTDSP